ncbi:hypothetical protein MTO96_038197, partial [Rhipicephalus appendiculatus]
MRLPSQTMARTPAWALWWSRSCGGAWSRTGCHGRCVVVGACAGGGYDCQTHRLPMVALRAYSSLAVSLDPCHISLPCDPAYHEPHQEVFERDPVRIQIANPAMDQMLKEKLNAVRQLLMRWTGVQDVQIQHLDDFDNTYIVVTATWQRLADLVPGGAAPAAMAAAGNRLWRPPQVSAGESPGWPGEAGFPRSKPQIFKKWLVNLRREKWRPSPGHRLCSDHFAESCFIRTGARTRLLADAVPTLFSFPDDSDDSPKNIPERRAPKRRDSDKNTSKRRAPKRRGQILDLTPEDEPPMSPAAPSPEDSDKMPDHDSAVLDNPEVLKRRLDKCTDAIEKIKNKLELSEQREHRLKNK